MTTASNAPIKGASHRKKHKQQRRGLRVRDILLAYFVALGVWLASIVLFGAFGLTAYHLVGWAYSRHISNYIEGGGSGLAWNWHTSNLSAVNRQKLRMVHGWLWEGPRLALQLFIFKYF